MWVSVSLLAASLMATTAMAATAVPLRITNIQLTNGNAVVRWEGGKGPYQLLYRTNLLSDWRKAGPATAGLVASNPLAAGPMCLFVVTTDLTAPPTPTSLRVTTNALIDRLVLTWNSTTDNSGGARFKGYNIYRDGGLLTMVSGPATNYTDRGLSADTLYAYAVSAIDEAANESARTAAVSTRTPRPPDLLAPSVPQNVTATASSCTNINLTWSASIDTGGAGLRGYQIYRNGAFWREVPAAATSTSDPTVNASTSYAYRITAIDNVGNASGQSAAASVTTPVCQDTTPPTVSLVFPTPGSSLSGSVTFRATAADDGGVSRVEFYQMGGGLIGTVAAAPFDLLVDTTRWSNGLRSFYCKAYDNANNQRSSATNSVTVSNAVVTGVSVDWVRTMTPPQSGSSVQAEAVASDPSGNTIIAGWFMGTVDLGAGLMSSTAAANSPDAFVQKRNAQGDVLWVRRFGGAGYDYAFGVATDTNGQIYVTGNFGGSVDFGGGPVTSAGAGDAFVVKLSPAGVHLWSRRFGGSDNDACEVVTTDAQGNAILALRYTWADINVGGVTLTNRGNGDIALVKLSANDGRTVWAKGLGGADLDNANAVAVDRAGDILVSGSFYGTADLGTGSLVSLGSSDGFVAKYSGTDGTCRWARRFGGAGGDQGRAVAIDPESGNVFVTGGFAGVVDFGGGGLDSGLGGGIFLVGLTASGGYLWGQVTGGLGDIGNGLAVDGRGNLVLTGKTSYAIYLPGMGAAVYSAGLPSFFVALLGVSGNTAPSSRWVHVSASTTGSSSGKGVTWSPAQKFTLTGSFAATVDIAGTPASTPGSSAGFAAMLSPR
jgi:hypothetical protein